MRLNKKGYMLVEIIIASVLAMSIAFYLLNLTYKFKDTSEDIYHSYNYMNDKISITKNIMSDLEKGIIFGDISPIDDEYQKGITFFIKIDGQESPVSRKLLFEKDDNNVTTIKYGLSIEDNFDTSDVSYYEKKLEPSLIAGDIIISEAETDDPDSLTIEIKIESIYDDEDYSIKLYAKKYEINEMKVLFTNSESEDYFKKEIYREKIKTASFVKDIDTSNAVSTDTVWYVSEKGDDSIVAWLEPNATAGYYNLYIGSENGEKIYSDSLKYFFKDCINLEKIDLSNFDASITKDLGSMFSNCSSLTELDVSKFNTSSVENMSHMFNGCSSLSKLDVSKFNTSKVTRMDQMFSGCSSLTELDVSHFDTSNVESMERMFYNCRELGKIILKKQGISQFDTSEVTSMRAMFANCSGLTELDLSSFVTSKVENMGGMFANCSSLTNLDISNFNTSSVKIYQETVEISDAEVYVGMFEECEKLITTITIKLDGDIQKEKVTYTNMFYKAATAEGAEIIVNYTTETSTLVDAMIATGTGNVGKGDLIE